MLECPGFVILGKLVAVYADLDLLYEYSNKMYFGLSVKNIFENAAPTIPITPKIPRSFVFETGYKF